MCTSIFYWPPKCGGQSSNYGSETQLLIPTSSFKHRKAVKCHVQWTNGQKAKSLIEHQYIQAKTLCYSRYQRGEICMCTMIWIIIVTSKAMVFFLLTIANERGAKGNAQPTLSWCYGLVAVVSWFKGRNEWVYLVVYHSPKKQYMVHEWWDAT